MFPAAISSTLTLLLLFSASCKNDPSERAKGATDPQAATSGTGLDAPVAIIDDVVITARELKRQLDQQSAPLRARYASADNKKEFLESLVRVEVLAKEAMARNLDKDPEVVQKVKQVMVQKLMQSQARSSIKPSDVTEQEMRGYYEKNRSRYNRPEEVRASAIVLKSKSEARNIEKMLRANKEKNPRLFHELVKKHSIDPLSKNRGGDLRYFRRDNRAIPEPVVAAAFALTQIGDVSQIIDGANEKFYVIKLTGRRKAVNKSFDEVKRQIRNQVYRAKRSEKQKEFIAQLKAKAKITIHEDKLAEIVVNAPNRMNNPALRQPKRKPSTNRSAKPTATPSKSPAPK